MASVHEDIRRTYDSYTGVGWNHLKNLTPPPGNCLKKEIRQRAEEQVLHLVFVLHHPCDGLWHKVSLKWGDQAHV